MNKIEKLRSKKEFYHEQVLDKDIDYEHKKKAQKRIKNLNKGIAKFEGLVNEKEYYSREMTDALKDSDTKRFKVASAELIILDNKLLKYYDHAEPKKRNEVENERV